MMIKTEPDLVKRGLDFEQRLSSLSAKMGGDGGSFVQRSELVTVKKQAKVLSEAEARCFRHLGCSLSKTKEPLREPLVACDLGYVYNKESVIRAILEKNMPKEYSHIRGLVDVIDLKMTQNPEYKADQTMSVLDLTQAAAVPFQCPITGLPFNGKYE